MHLFIYLILKSYPKYKIDKDIADNADKNRKNQQNAHRAHVTHCSWDTYTKDNVFYVITLSSRHYNLTE